MDEEQSDASSAPYGSVDEPRNFSPAIQRPSSQTDMDMDMGTGDSTSRSEHGDDDCESGWDTAILFASVNGGEPRKQ